MADDGNVVVLPGVNRPDLELPMAASVPLASAMKEALRDVVVVGRRIDGELVVWGSQTDADAVIGLLSRGVEYLSRFVQTYPQGDEDNGSV